MYDKKTEDKAYALKIVLTTPPPTPNKKKGKKREESLLILFPVYDQTFLKKRKTENRTDKSLI